MSSTSLTARIKQTEYKQVKFIDMKPKRSEIEKVFLYDYRDYQIRIERNFGKDCFLSIYQVENLPEHQRPKILLGPGVRTLFLTLKGAKKQGVQIIDNLMEK